MTVDAAFELGQTNTQVQVAAETQQVETSTSTVGLVVEQKLVEALPLSSRNFTQILALSPGVNASVANAGALGRNSVNISANGSRPYDNSLVLNGWSRRTRCLRASTTTWIKAACQSLLRTH